ncbi:MAG: hypothetical protein MPJ25_13610, partial [Pirellulales bacterium]|nr:hypothetical protein [Pirellulales bacterium]
MCIRDSLIAGRGYRREGVGLSSSTTDAEKFITIMRVSSEGTRELNAREDLAETATSEEMAYALLGLPDGKFLTVGESDGHLFVSRYLASGVIDETFATAGSFVSVLQNTAAAGYQATLTTDGKILIAGKTANGVTDDLLVVQLNQDGTLDDAFGTGGYATFDFAGNDQGYSIVTQPDGKIVVAGESEGNIAILRLLGQSDQSGSQPNAPPVNSVPSSQTATVDVPFAFSASRGNQLAISDPDAGENSVQVTLAVDSGTLTLGRADPNGRITYLSGDGKADASMTMTGTIADLNTVLGWVSYQSAAGTLGEATLTITTDDLGHAGTGGNQTDIDTIAITVAPAAYAPSPVHPILPATLDPSYNGTGKQTLSLSAGTDSIRDMHVTDEGKIIAVGSVNNLFGIIRFNADMTLDNTFGTGGFTATDLGAGVHATALTVDASGRSIVVGGQKIVRYTADGLLDETFGTAGVATDDLIYRAHDVTLEANGEILVTGDVFEAEFVNAPTTSDSRILREIDRELKVCLLYTS